MGIERATGEELMRTQLTACVSGYALAIACAAAPAAAQTVGGRAAGVSVSEVIVTATKRGENVQDIPAAVSSLSGEQLSERGVTNVEQLSHVVPNLNFGLHAGATFVTIRGVGSTINSGVTETTVASYVDGLYLPRATMGSLQQVDLERVEVLRGPQGTLYGRNATGGAVNFISRAPTREFSGEANLLAGSRDNYGVSAFVSGPMTESVLFRLSGGYNEHDSYLKVIPGDHSTNVSAAYVRGAVRLEPTENLSIDLSVKYERDKGADTYQQAFTLPTVPLPPGTLVTIEPNRTAADFPFSQDLKTLILNGTVSYRLSDAISIRSVTGYIDHKATTSFDGDNTSFALQAALDFERPSEAFSQELVAYGEAGPLQWLVGAFLYREDFTNNLPVLLPSGQPGALPPGSVINLNLAKEKTKSYAFFTDLTWSVTDRFRINGGLRYNAEKKNFLFDFFIFVPGAGRLAEDISRSEIDSYRILPKLGVQYDVSDDVNVYASYQEGFKSGGHDIALPRTFGPELLKSYEAGVKAQWLDRTLTTNAAFFYYDYNGLQITNNTGPTTTQVENADARIYGLEGEATWRLGRNLELNASATWLDAEYTDFESFDAARPELGLLDLSGVQVIQSPDFTIKAGAQYALQLGGGLFSELLLRGDVAYTDDVVLRYFATANDTQKGYTLVNLSATLNSEDGKTSLRAFVNNLGNKKYKRMVDYLLAVGTYDGNYGEPRSWGVQLTRRF
jgi:iron complex outermembrane receptor protein